MHTKLLLAPLLLLLAAPSLCTPEDAPGWSWDTEAGVWSRCTSVGSTRIIGAQEDTDDEDPAQLLLVTRSRHGVAAAVLHDGSPSLLQIDGLFSRSEAYDILTLAWQAQRAGTSQRGRTGGVIWLPHNASATVSAVVERVAELVGLPSNCSESLQVAWYGLGEGYREHYDAFDLSEGGVHTDGGDSRRILTAVTPKTTAADL